MSEANFSQRVLIRSILGRRDGGAGLVGRTLKVGGWVKRGRSRGFGSSGLVDLNDGSCLANLQLIISSNVGPVGLFTPTGTCLHVEGVLQILSGDQQRINCLGSAYMLNVSKVIHVGPADPAVYPLPKTGLTLEFLRDYVHLRPRSDLISAILRIRNALAYATHTFFQRHDFLYVHTPSITTIDCEGAGEMFPVTTVINEAERIEMDLIENPPPYQEEVAMADEAGKPAITSAVVELSKAKENLANVEKRFNLKPGIPKKDGKVDYGQDFFARQAFLTVSGQLHVETFACALVSVYTFGPTFRAEHSHTSRHLEEFWMVEPEIAFADIEDDMKCAEEYVRFLCRWLLDNCLDDMEFVVEKFDTNAIRRLEMVASTNFLRLSYTEAVAILEDAVSKGYKFENKVEWGIDFASEHEKYLTETEFESPVIVYNYPKETKAFYMKLNSDKNTVAAMDVLVPKVGKLIGGSQREENYKVIEERILELGLPLEPYEWYLDLRRYGTVQHSGFGLVFERMILFATGIDNIRDVIPFPRRADV